MLFTADRRSVMVSDAVAYFLTTPVSEGHEEMVGEAAGGDLRAGDCVGGGGAGGVCRGRAG